MKLAQLSFENLIVCMLAEDWELYKNSKFAKTQTFCEYTKTGRVKKGTEYQNTGIKFIKYINFADLHHDIKNRDTAEYKMSQLKKIHDRIVKDSEITFNFAANNWLPRGMTKTEFYKKIAKLRQEYEVCITQKGMINQMELKQYYKGLFLGIIETAFLCNVIDEKEYNELLDSPMNF